MSVNSIIASNNKIYNDLLPNPYPYPAQPPSLAQVLIAGDDAGNGNIENLLQLQATNIVQQAQIGGHLTIGGTPSNPGSGGDLRIQGATDIGSILVGDGTSTIGFPVGADGLVLKANSAQPLGVEWGVDGTGGITSVNSGTNINVDNTNPLAPIVNLQSPLTTDLFLGSVNMTAGDPTTQTHLISNNGGASYTSANNVGGQILATYTATSMSISDPSIQKNIVIAPPTGIFLNDQSGATILDSEITEAQVQVKSQTAGSLTQATLTQSDLQYTNTDSTISPTFTDTSTYGNCSRSASSLDNTTGTNAVRTESISRISGSNQVAQFNDIPTHLQITQSLSTNNTGCVYTGVSEQLISSGVNQLGTFGGSSTTGQAELTTSYQNLTPGSLYTSTAGYTANGGGSSSLITSADITGGRSHLLRMECPAIGNALIEHTSVGVIEDLDITTQGRLSLISGQQGFLIQGNPLNLTAVAGNVSGSLINTGLSHINRTTAVSNISAPSYLFQNENSSNASFPVIQLARPVPASVAGDTLGAITFFGDDAGGGVSREWARIQTKAENVSGGNQDGTLSIFTSVNGTISEVANYNGAQNENNTFRPFDLNNNDIRTSTGNILLTGTLSSGAGSIELKTKDATPGAGTGLILTGNTLQSGSAGGNSGQHLCITLNGNVYKIALLNP